MLSSSSSSRVKGGFLAFLIVVGGALAFLCRDAFLPHHVSWANDVPLGAMMDPSNRLPGAFSGDWTTLYWIGGAAPSPSPSFSALLQTIFPPTIYLKFFLPFCMFFLGLSAWFFFRQLNFAAPVCVIGGLGAGLNMHYFSNATWGLGTWALSAGMVLVALGVIVSPRIRPLWVKAALAGLATGLVVMEGFDVGSILTLYIGVFVVFYFLREAPTPTKGIPKALIAGVILVLFALLISGSTLFTLVGTQIKGTVAVGPTREADAKMIAELKQKESSGTISQAEKAHLDEMKKVAAVDSGLFAELRDKARSGTLTPSEKEDLDNMEHIHAEQVFHWHFTTQWSFPKLESLRLFIPGLFGYRLNDYITDTNRASAYWGSIAEDPRIYELESSDRETRIEAAESFNLSPEDQAAIAGSDISAHARIAAQAKGMGVQLRHTGSGDYTGLLVCLLGVFALCNTWRKSNSPFSKNERESVWFWAVAAFISLTAAWGRYGPVYQFFYHLPFLNNIRSPIKFLHPLNVCLIILSGYGLEVLHRLYLQSTVNRTGNLLEHVSRWWKQAARFEKKWAIATLVLLGVSVLGWLVMSSSKSDLVSYLQHAGFGSQPPAANDVADFAIKEVLLYCAFLAVCVAVFIIIMSKAWTGKNARIAWVILGTIMFVDLARADIPWVRYYDYEQKFSMNPVVDYLRDKPWEHRINSRFLPTGGYIGSQVLGLLGHWWLENDYLINKIQSLEIDQAPRLPELDKNFIDAFTPHTQQDLASPIRLWRLTNTRYIFADGGATAAFNQIGHPQNSFRDVMKVDPTLKPGLTQQEDFGDVTVVPNTNGHFALIEFTAALPRVKLYSNWTVTNDATVLAKLDTDDWDPERTVFVMDDTPVTAKPGSAFDDPGTVSITDYQPRDVKITADAKTPSVMLLNDRTGDYWKVWVDDKPAEVLRCNYIMRGVFLPSGHHNIEFHFRAPMQWFYVSASAVAFGLLMIGYVCVSRLKKEDNDSGKKD